MPQKTLYTRRLVLRPLTNEHLDHFTQLNSHVEVLKYIQGRALTAEESVKDHTMRMEAGTLVPGLGVWSGFLVDTGEFVGWWALSPMKDAASGGVPRSDAGNLGYRLLPRFWRQGLAKEGSRELLRYGFEDLGLQSAWADTMTINEASRATMASCGLKYVQTFFVEFEDPLPGTELGEVEYCITSAEWADFSADQKL